jgi:hypothetical protein
MNLSDIGIVCGLCVSLFSAGGTVGLNYADQRYVTVSSQNLKLLYAAEDELEELNSRAVCDEACIARKATLKERIRNLQ